MDFFSFRSLRPTLSRSGNRLHCRLTWEAVPIFRAGGKSENSFHLLNLFGQVLATQLPEGEDEFNNLVYKIKVYRTIPAMGFLNLYRVAKSQSLLTNDACSIQEIVVCWACVLAKSQVPYGLIELGKWGSTPLASI